MTQLEISLRTLTRQDLKEYAYCKLPTHQYHGFNGSYYKKYSEEEVRKKKIISNSRNEMLGEVNWYWKSEETNWLEV